MFECLDKLRRSFVPGSIEFVYVFGRRVGRSDYEKSGALKEDDFSCRTYFCEGGEVFRQDGGVGD